MWYRLLVWLTPLLLLMSFASPVQAQTAAGTTEDEEAISPTPALAYTLALLSTFLVLLIICKPSRKS